MSRITHIPTPMRVWLWRGFSLLIAIAILLLVLSMVDWQSFRVLLERLDAPQPAQLARQLQFLFEGAITMAHMEGPGEQGRDAQQAAEALLKAAGV